MKFSVIKLNQSLWLIFCSCWLLASPTALSLSAYGKKAGQKKLIFSDTTQKKSVCSHQGLAVLTTNLLRDLPNYANRASQRSRRLARKTDIFSYVIFAGRPEFTPLPLNLSSYTPESDATISPDVDQVFFTTLKRQYIAGKMLESQEFHWLLLTKTESGWRKVMMFSQTGSSQFDKMPTPPRESSNGYIGQAIDTWLRDCRAGSVGG
ncbi:MAG: hypothetical protein QNJ51_02140 [Calothrix sp. MO_167.B12]|nr:hypothetical protein [Calothrix sp. MO_167.B12]